MEWIKRFFKDESASSEITSSVLLIGAVVIVAGAALAAFWGAIDNFFTEVSEWVQAGADEAGRSNFPITGTTGT